MLDHFGVRVQDYARAMSFYKAALSPIGYEVVMEFPDAAGLGEKGKPDFWITQAEQAQSPTHFAFVCDRASVDAFHIAAIAAGGTDNGAPGLRPDYHPHYYAAYVLDPEGNNVEVVCHEPPGAPRASAAPRARPARKASRKPAPKGAAQKQAKQAAKKPAKQAAAKKPAAKAKAPKARKTAKAAKAKARGGSAKRR